MTCPYASTCLASRLPTDNICATCTIREALERGAAERDAFLRATYPRPGDVVRRAEFTELSKSAANLETSFLAGAPISAKPSRCKKSDADWVAGKTCSPCDGCEATP